MQGKDIKNHDVVLESASALMDGEASELDLHRVLKATAQNPVVAETWQRYHLVRASLRQEVHNRPRVNLLEGIKDRLRDEDHPVSDSLRRRFAKPLRRIGQGAIAASVAFTVLHAASFIRGVDSGLSGSPSVAVQESGQAADTSAQLPSLGGDFTPSELSRTVSMDAAARKRLQQAVYQSSMSQERSLGEPYVFPEVDAVSPAVLQGEASRER